MNWLVEPSVLVRRAIVGLVICLAAAAPAAAQDERSDAGREGLAAIIEVPERLQRDVVAGAAGVFARHCARCHQTGKLERLSPAAGFDGILDIDGLLRRPDLVMPGRPDASRLYQAMLTRHMPFDVFQDGKPGAAPSAAEIRQVRDWIAGSDAPRTCEEGQPAQSAVSERLLDWVSERSSVEVARTRFISIAHLANRCGGDSNALVRHRAGVIEALGAASWSVDPLRAVQPIDAAGDVLAIDLAGLGWTVATWDMVARSGAGIAAAPQIAWPLSLLEATQTASPLMTGDYLAAALSQPDVYAQVMQFPSTRRVFEAVVGYRLGAPGKAVMAVAENSQQTGSARLIWRRGYGRQSYAWWSLEAPKTGGAAATKLLRAYLSGEGNGAAGSHVLLRLPSGFMAAASFDADGALDTTISAHSEAASSRSYAGQPRGLAGCLSCHAAGPLSGPKPLAESVRVAGPADDARAPEYFDAAQLEARLASDRFDLLEARRRARLARASEAGALAGPVNGPVAGQATGQAAGQVAGTEGLGSSLEDTMSGALASLAREHLVPIDIERAASEFGIPVERLERLLAGVTGAMLPAARRLLGRGLVTRAEAAALSENVPGHVSGPVSGHVFGRDGEGHAAGPHATGFSIPPVHASGPPVGLSIWAEKPAYEVGEAATFFAAADRDCNLTLINVDQGGQATVLFPSEFHPGNALKAGEIVRVPGEGAGYRLSFAAPGREQLIGICMEGQRRFPAGIRINYERQRFTLLGEWEKYLDTYLAADAKERANVGKKKAKRRLRWRRKGYRQPERTTREPLPQLRSAIGIEIR